MLKINNICIKTLFEEDGYKSKYEYLFANEKESCKFVNGKEAVDCYGESHRKSYYEIVNSVTADVDADSLYEQLYSNEINKHKVLFHIGDEVCYACNNYFATQKIVEIKIDRDGVTYVTDSPRLFTNDAIGKTIFHTYDEAKECMLEKYLDGEQEI